MKTAKTSGNGLRTVAVIPARYASSRFPGKPLAVLCGKPMIQHVYERVLRTPGLDDVLVATDDSRIEAAVIKFGGKCVMTGECRTGTDRVCQAVRSVNADVVLNVQGDEPLIDPECLGQLLKVFGDAEVQMATLRRKLADGEGSDPNVVKLVCALNGDALYFSRLPIPFLRGQACPLFAHVGVYAYRKPFLEALTAMPSTPLELAESLEQLRVLENGHKIRTVLTAHSSIGVDTPDDLLQAEARMRQLIARGEMG